MKPKSHITAVLMLAALLGGCRAYADPRIYRDPRPMPRFCDNEEDRRLPSGVCVRRPIGRDDPWRRDHVWRGQGGNPRAREFYDQQERWYGGSTPE